MALALVVCCWQFFWGTMALRARLFLARQASSICCPAFPSPLSPGRLLTQVLIVASSAQRAECVWVQPNAWPARPGHFSHSLLVVHNEEWTGLYWRVGQPLFDTRVRGASIWKLWKKEKGKRQRQKCSLQGFHAFMWEEEMRWFKAAQIKKGPQEAVQDYFTRQSDQIEFFCWVQCVE